MANSFDPAVTTYFVGATATGGTVTFPLGTVEGVTDATTAADIRQVLYGIIEKFSDKYLADIAADPLNKSDNVTVTRTASVPDDNTLRKTYAITFNLDLPDLSVDTVGDA
jgi:hypothetical protein